MSLNSIYPEVTHELSAWVGYPVLLSAMEQLEELQVFLAGGVIRNSLLPERPAAKDFDLFLGPSSLEPALDILELHGILEHTPFGNPRWFPFGNRDCYADLIPMTNFVTGLWKCEEIVDVLNQFDFTANAMAFDLRTGAFFNPQNGLRDLTRRTMRMIRFDYPEGPFASGESMSRNTVLWFRVLHYASSLGLAIEPLTLEWLREHRSYEEEEREFEKIFFSLNSGYLDPIRD